MRWLSETAKWSLRVLSCWRNEDALCRLPVTDREVSDGEDMTGGQSEVRATQRSTWSSIKYPIQRFKH